MDADDANASGMIPAGVAVPDTDDTDDGDDDDVDPPICSDCETELRYSPYIAAVVCPGCKEERSGVEPSNVRPLD